MNDTDELKTCECGHKKFRFYLLFGSYHLKCKCCGLYIILGPGTKTKESRKKAIEVWNRRMEARK